MNNIVTIKAAADNHAEFIIHPKKAFEINLERKNLASLCFGNQRQFINVKMNEKIPQENILLSKSLIEELHLPEYLIYEICVDKNEIIIGPYIGLLISKEDKKLTSARLRKMTAYVKEYSKLHGAVVLFALDKVDTSARLIEGYCYNPVQNLWQRGIFPYPSSIYRTIGLSRKWKNHFLSAIGDKIFNNPFFSKWKMYTWFSKNTGINSHIPYTSLYQSYQDVFNLLARFGKIYIKPVLGLRGSGIVQASKEDNVFVFKYRDKGVNYKIELMNPIQAGKFIQERFRDGKYLIQQAVDLLEYEGGIVDFRCVMQKNQSKEWICKAVIGRQGDKDSIVSNISSGGKAFPALDILEKTCSSFEDNIIVLNKKIASLALDVCNVLDEYGINSGILGIDIGVDTQGNLWLIEINNRDPDLTIALDINDEELYHTLKADQLFYAKSLAGFSGFNISRY